MARRTLPCATHAETSDGVHMNTAEFGVDEKGMVKAPTAPGVGLPVGPEYPKELESYVVDLAGDPLSA